MNIIHPSKYDKSAHSFLFNAQLKAPLVILKEMLRSEQEYDEDSNPEKAALNTIRTISKYFDGNIYSVITNQRLVKNNSFHAKKNILPPQSALKKLEQRKIKAPFQDGLIQQGLVVSLAGFDYAMGDKLILNFVHCLFVLSRQDLDGIYPMVTKWLSGEATSSFAFNCVAIGQDLVNCEETALMRYFPADNGRHEMLAIIGNEAFVNSTIRPMLALQAPEHFG